MFGTFLLEKGTRACFFSFLIIRAGAKGWTDLKRNDHICYFPI
jgi:hypothetical protein